MCLEKKIKVSVHEMSTPARTARSSHLIGEAVREVADDSRRAETSDRQARAEARAARRNAGEEKGMLLETVTRPASSSSSASSLTQPRFSSTSLSSTSSSSSSTSTTPSFRANESTSGVSELRQREPTVTLGLDRGQVKLERKRVKLERQRVQWERQRETIFERELIMLGRERAEYTRLAREIGVGVYEELLPLVNKDNGTGDLRALNARVRLILEWEREPIEVENVRASLRSMSAAGHRRWQAFIRTY